MGLTENNHNTVLNNLRAGGDVGTSLSSAFSSSFCGGDWEGGILCFHFRRMLDLDWKSTHKKGGEGGSGKKKIRLLLHFSFFINKEADILYDD